MNIFNWKALRAVIESSDHRLEALAEAFGVTTQTILGWKRGANPPSSHHIPAISKFFGIRVDDLWIDVDDFTKLTDEQKAEIKEKQHEAC